MLIKITGFKNRWSWENSRKSERNRVWYIHHLALTAIGLLIVGVDLWLILAITAGLLTFIPNFGPIIAIIPAVMVGFMQGPEVALWIFILYFFVQLVESNIITPAMQKKMLDTPVALLLFFK